MGAEWTVWSHVQLGLIFVHFHFVFVEEELARLETKRSDAARVGKEKDMLYMYVQIVVGFCRPGERAR